MELVAEKLRQLGMTEYTAIFEAHGFDDWATLMDVTENDLIALSVRPADREKLHRAIAAYSAAAGLKALDVKVPQPESSQHDRPGNVYGGRHGSSSSSSKPVNTFSDSAEPTLMAHAQPKRKHSRHNKYGAASGPPLNAYVRFAKDMHESYKAKQWDFAQRVKQVGEDWTNLDAATKARYVEEAAQDRIAYEARLRQKDAKEQNQDDEEAPSFQAGDESDEDTKMPHSTHVLGQEAKGKEREYPYDLRPPTTFMDNEGMLYNLDDLRSAPGQSERLDALFRHSSPHRRASSNSAPLQQATPHEQRLPALDDLFLPSLGPNPGADHSYGIRSLSSESPNQDIAVTTQTGSHAAAAAPNANTYETSEAEEDLFGEFINSGQSDESSSTPKASRSDT